MAEATTDIKTLGTAIETGLGTLKVTIDGVAIHNSVTISEGYQTITPIIGDSGSTEAVVMNDTGIEISISGHLTPGATVPKNGDACTITGYTVCWIDGVSLARTPSGAAVFSCTAHGRKKTAAPAS